MMNSVQFGAQPLPPLAKSAPMQSPVLFGGSDAVYFGRGAGGDGEHPPFSLKAKFLTGLAGFGLFMGTITGVAGWETVGKGQSCAVFNKTGGDYKGYEEDAVGAGWSWKTPFTKEYLCFDTSQALRVTEKIQVKSLERVPVTLNISIAWQPNPNQLPRVAADVYGTGGTNALPQEVQEQIKHGGNRVLYENAMYSEVRSMILEIAALVPAHMLESDEFKAVVYDAFLNGYDPKEVYDKFKEFRFEAPEAVSATEAEQAQTEIDVLLENSEQRPSLQDRISQRFAVRDENGNIVNNAPVILITDADLRDSNIDSAEYQQALNDLAQFPILQQQQVEQAELNRLKQEALEAEQIAREAVETARAKADGAYEVEMANQQAEALGVLGAIFREYPELVDKLIAEGILAAGENGSLILLGTDGEGIIINPSTGTTANETSSSTPTP